ncbi:MAG TPA: response regulator [Candidatus Polarisedimenticolaceae bacterium]|nr:response regulator [Candidatus Polarisedimenticolaceae bacterium]
MKSILVVDDDRVTRHLLSSVLEKAGFRVTSASNGPEALERAKANPDLILLDIWMPGMSGLDVLERLRADGTSCPVVVTTSDDTPDTLLKALRGQALHFLSKPVDPAALVEMVETALSGDGLPGIEVVSATKDWVELVVPCTRQAAARIEGFLAHLDAHLTADVRESVGYAFRELLLNAVEWGGKLDPNRKVRIAYLRAKRMLLYRIADPGTGFRLEDLSHAAIAHENDPIEHMRIREEKGLRPGGFGLLLVRAKVDELIYNEARNEVVFVKYLEEPKG